MTAVPFPSEIVRQRRRRRLWHWLPLLAVVALLVSALAFRTHPAAVQRPAPAASHHVLVAAPPAHPAKAPGIRLTVGRAVYACTPVQPKRG